MPKNQILIGTAGWSYPDWQGAVYPHARSPERLRIVAEYMDCVEVDNSFYRPPTARMSENWLQSVADRRDFRFVAKAWQRFTHQRQEPWSQPEVDLFTSGVSPLRESGRLDALLFQFPWSFRNAPANREWLKRIGESFADWPIAVEVRHDSWLGEEVEDFFRAQRFIYCNIDQPTLAHCVPLGERVTSATGYLRLHGRNAKNWFRDKQEVYGGRYDYLYAESELNEILFRVRAVAQQTKTTFVIFNNHKDGKAFANALQLKAALQPESTVRAPATLLTRFPSLGKGIMPVGEGQLPLI
jgi:uncharacterized protein YecE (DUF72 family)